MKTIELRHPYQATSIPDESVVLILGFFDGVYRGHQAVIRRAQDIAKEKGLKTALMTFNQHPSIVFRKMSKETMTYLTNPTQKKPG